MGCIIIHFICSLNGTRRKKKTSARYVCDTQHTRHTTCTHTNRKASHRRPLIASAPNAASMAAVESGDAVEGEEDEEDTARPLEARHAFTAAMNLS